MGGSSDSESGSGSGSDSGRSNRSQKKDKSHKKDKKDKKGSGDESKSKDKKDKDKGKDKKDKGDKDKKDKGDKDKKDKGDKDKKDKKDDKKDDKHKTDSKSSSQLPTQIAHALSGTALGGLAQEFLSGGGGGGHGLLREGGTAVPGAAPTIPSNPATGPGTGASGQRIPASTTEPFPSQAAGPAPPFVDSTGQPVYVGSALVDPANVQPCRVTPSAVYIAEHGAEVTHTGRYDLLPLTDAMEWLPASGGAPPAGKRLVEGGIESGLPLHHACARVDSVLLPGKAGPTLGGAQIPDSGTAHFFAQDYYALCWRE